MDFVDDVDGETFLRARDTFRRYYTITFVGAGNKNEQTADKTAQAVLTKWISFFFWTPGAILADKAARFAGGRFRIS